MKPSREHVRGRIAQRKRCEAALKTWVEPEPDAIVAGFAPAFALRMIAAERLDRMDDARRAHRGLPTRRQRLFARMGWEEG